MNDREPFSCGGRTANYPQYGNRLDGEPCPGCGYTFTTCWPNPTRDGWIGNCLDCGESDWTIDKDGHVFFANGDPGENFLETRSEISSCIWASDGGETP